MSALPPEVTKKIRDDIMAATERRFRTKRRVKNVSKELDLLGHSDITDFLDPKKYSDYIPNLQDLREGGKTRAIKKIKLTRKIKRATAPDGQTVDDIIDETFEFELHAKAEVLGQEIDVMGLKSAQRLEVMGRNGGPIRHEVDCGETVRAVIERLNGSILGPPTNGHPAGVGET